MRAGKMGRREEGRRLAVPVSNMADEIMADVSEDRNLQNRPLHHAYLRCKLPWPRIECRGDARKVFFEEKGLAQHFRIKHARVVFDNVKQVREAWRLFRYLHGEETKEHSRRLSAERQQVSVFYCLVKFAVHLALEYS